MKKTVQNISLKKEGVADKSKNSSTKNLVLQKQNNTRMEKIYKELEKLNSPKRKFFLGVLHGFAVALGASIVFALALSVFAKIITESKQVKWLATIIEKTQIETLIHQSLSDND